MSCNFFENNKRLNCKMFTCAWIPLSSSYSKVQHTFFYEQTKTNALIEWRFLFVFNFVNFLLFSWDISMEEDNKIYMWIYFAVFLDKRFTPNNTAAPQTTTTPQSVSSSPIAEKRSTITVTKKSSNKQHVNQTIIVPPVANSTLHAKGRWSQSNTILMCSKL